MKTEPEEVDDRELEEIGEAECWQLLATKPVGRLAVVVGQYPVVFPLNYSVAAHGVVLRTGVGAKLSAIHRSNVSFQVDDIDEYSHRGWSVLVRGTAREVTSETANEELLDLVEDAAPRPWVPGPRDHLLRIVVDSITGRRLTITEGLDATRMYGYL